MTNNKNVIERQNKSINRIILYHKVFIQLVKIKEFSTNFFFLKKYMKRANYTDKYNTTISNKTGPL